MEEAPVVRSTQDRKVELDWLRAGVVAAVLVFHTARFSDGEGWHVKNATLHPGLAAPVMFFVAWVYLERVSHGELRGSFLAFLPRYFHGLYGYGGNFAWMGLHLWYLELLLAFSLGLLPLLLSGPRWVALGDLAKWRSSPRHPSRQPWRSTSSSSGDSPSCGCYAA